MDTNGIWGGAGNSSSVACHKDYGKQNQSSLSPLILFLFLFIFLLLESTPVFARYTMPSGTPPSGVICVLSNGASGNSSAKACFVSQTYFYALYDSYAINVLHIITSCPAGGGTVEVITTLRDSSQAPHLLTMGMVCYGTPVCQAGTGYNTLTGMCDQACPANSSGTPPACVCNAGFKFDAAGTSCVPDKLTITLSGGTTTEPWHKKHDKEHLKANLPYKAIVKDQNDQPKAGFAVTITTDVTSDSGGHVHSNGRPKGKLIVGTGASTKAGKETINGMTNGVGIFEFTFGAEEASGTHTLTAKCDSGCQAPATATVDVGIKGLMLLDADPLGYILRGERPVHPDNHYFSPAALVNIINLAHYYRVKFGKPLILNDSSLIKGGLFDISGQWAPSHKSHRRGIVIDINNYRTAPNKDFEELAKKFGITPVWEGLNVTDTPHYHLWLTRKDN